MIKLLLNILFNNKHKQEKTCMDCDKRATMRCPNSSVCYSLDSKPYWSCKS